ncbi:hypothetical protein [Mucilaginibacter flavidus]|uniref:hypothetical protein n=1 Tax=Mucilaginibacter flavidus TaxID=2949309 RepID=UPI002092B65A|nr:hypothetical protein [Mucilaginibacter flavidus]MCO5949110.1 hypothetical protein [Mucilaginibacter flavidus]
MQTNLPALKKNVLKYFKINALLAFVFLSALMTPQLTKAQTPPDTIKVQGATYQKVKEKPEYPKVVGYLSFIVPIVTHADGKFTPNFDHHIASIGFPVGVNVLYSAKFGFSYEFTPTIKSSGGTSKMSNLLFDPGTMFRFEHGFTIITRLAFETSGRYGFTPVFNKVYARSKDVNYFVALSLPNRFGNADPYSIGLNVQFGFTFN